MVVDAATSRSNNSKSLFTTSNSSEELSSNSNLQAQPSSLRMTGFLRKFGKKNKQQNHASTNTSASANNTTRARGGGGGVDIGRRVPLVSDNDDIVTVAVKTEPPQRKRKSADKMSIVISPPPWKSPTVGDMFPNFCGKFTTPADLLDADALEGAVLTEETNEGFSSSSPCSGSNTMIRQSFAPSNSISSYYDYQGDDWGLMIMLPCYDFSSVSISELVVLMSPEMQTELTRRNVKVCCFTVNPCTTNRNWVLQALTDYQNSGRDGVAKVHFPIYCDNRTFDNAVEIGALDEEQTDEYGVPILYRTTTFVRPDKTIAMSMQQPGNIGRDFTSILRQLDQLQDRPSEDGNSGATQLVMSKMIDRRNVEDEFSTK